MKYDVDYFINKFEAIPENEWLVHEYWDGDKCCALGHCGMTDTKSFSDEPEAESLWNIILFITGISIVSINDREDCSMYRQESPKERVLAALRDIKAKQSPIYTDITKSMAILPISETADQPIKQLS